MINEWICIRFILYNIKEFMFGREYVGVLEDIE